jgi:hypothetical protein
MSPSQLVSSEFFQGFLVLKNITYEAKKYKSLIFREFTSKEPAVCHQLSANGLTATAGEREPR